MIHICKYCVKPLDHILLMVDNLSQILSLRIEIFRR